MIEKDPFQLLNSWHKEARKAKIKDLNLMTLATVGSDGRPAARIVLFKEVNEKGFTFFTNFRSRKACEIKQNPYASAVIYWQDLGYQIRVEGMIKRISAEESDRYFNSRPHESQLSAWASDQSKEIPSYSYLQSEMDRYSKIYNEQEVPRPSYWGGYRLVPDRFEFWKEGKDRLHERVWYEKDETLWNPKVLAP